MTSKVLLILLLSCAWCMGVFGLFTPGQLLGDVGDWAEDNVSKWIFKPTIGCMTCMGSVHGLVIYMFFLYADLGPLLVIPFMVCLAGINFFFSQFLTE